MLAMLIRYKRDVFEADDSGTTEPTTPVSMTTTVAHRASYPQPYTPKPPTSDKSTDTIAAVTVALLAVILVVAMVLIFRAIKKRRQARRGRELNAIATVSTGVMGTGTAAYSNIHVSGPVTWESISTNGGTHDTNSQALP